MVQIQLENTTWKIQPSNMQIQPENTTLQNDCIVGCILGLYFPIVFSFFQPTVNEVQQG